jgi:hypothetical protein
MVRIPEETPSTREAKQTLSLTGNVFKEQGKLLST